MLQPTLQILQKWGQQKRIKRGKKCSSGMLDGTFPERLHLFEVSIWNKKKHLENIWNGKLY